MTKLKSIMFSIHTITGLLSVISLIFSAVLLREFMIVTGKRRRLIADLGGSGRAVRRFKHSLMTVYLLSSIGWALGLYFYSLLLF